MSIKIRESRLIPYNMQAGEGAPSHLSPAGTFYFDILAGVTYQNIDGLSNWSIFFSSSNNSFLGQYLPLSGGTMTGGLVANSGVTASTISQTTYIDFTTGSTNLSSIGGRVFFDNTAKALAYYDISGNNVPIAMGQQLYTRVWNATGSQIDKGKVIAITGTSNGLPSAILARNQHAVTSARPIGLSAENIPNNSEGLVLNNGILSGITLNTFSNGDTLYLSDTVAGGYVSTTSALSFTARTNEIGYVVQTGSTTGKIYVNISNEDSNLSLTAIERNILEGNVISTGVFAFSGISLASTSTFNVGAAEAWIVDNTSNPLVPEVMYVKYSGQTNVPSLYYTSATETYLLITSAATLVQQTTFPTPQQRRQNVYLGKMGHGNRTSLINAFNEPDLEVSPLSQLRDMFSPIKLINENVYPSPHTGLTFNTSSGTLWGLGIGFVTNQLNPSSLTITANTPTTFQYRTQTGGTATNRTTIDPANYDLNGIITSIGSPAKQATNQRIFLLQNGQFRIQYGQTKYADLTTAIAAVTNEVFTNFSNFRDNAILIAVLSIRSDATLLSDVAQAKITFASKFGESVGGTGGISTTTLQQAYDNSTDPEIVINSTLDGLTIKNGTGNPDATTHLIGGQNAAGSVTSFITADGGFSGSSVSAVTITTASVTANATGLTSKSTYGTVNVTPNTNNGMIIFSGSGTVGGTGYTDFIRVTNTAAGATNINKTFRTSITGDLEIVNSAYSALSLSLTNSGVLNTPGGGTSDKRLKHNIEYISIEALPIIQQFKPVKFEFNEYKDIVRHGFIAQDVLEFKPELVLGDGDKENGVYGLDYDGILALTVKALQESIKRIENLEKQIQELKNK